jgi:hypothetical protein
MSEERDWLPVKKSFSRTDSQKSNKQHHATDERQNQPTSI